MKKKSTLKKSTTGIKAAQARTKAVRFKARQALQKANEMKRILKFKLKALQAEFKQKLQETAQKSYEKAVADIYQQQEQKHAAKFKILSAAEAKFEKRYAAKMNKKLKKTFKAPVAKSKAPQAAAPMKKSTRTIRARRTYKKRSARAA